MEQEAQKGLKRSIEQRKILKRNREQEKNPGARKKVNKEHGAYKNEKCNLTLAVSPPCDMHVSRA